MDYGGRLGTCRPSSKKEQSKCDTTGLETASERNQRANDLDSEFRGVFSEHVKTPGAFQKYTALEEQTLMTMYAQGIPVPQIALHLGRIETGVVRRAMMLGLSRKRALGWEGDNEKILSRMAEGLTIEQLHEREFKGTARRSPRTLQGRWRALKKRPATISANRTNSGGHDTSSKIADPRPEVDRSFVQLQNDPHPVHANVLLRTLHIGLLVRHMPLSRQFKMDLLDLMDSLDWPQHAPSIEDITSGSDQGSCTEWSDADNGLLIALRLRVGLTSAVIADVFFTDRLLEKCDTHLQILLARQGD
jgi:hypothetical protein